MFRSLLLFFLATLHTTSVVAIDEYDFIVVGSGSSGTVVATRLSEVTKWRVLLLEAGGEPDFLMEVPLLAPALQFTDHNWGYTMEKQVNACLAMRDQRCAWPRGKVLGGSSSINYMLYVRGNRLDYDRWAGLGNPGWSYADVLPYFKKLEDFLAESGDPGYHQQGGPIAASNVPYRTESAAAFLLAATQTGHKLVDYNGKEQLGFSYAQTTTKNARRCSTEKGYLRPVRGRPNLTVSTESRVTKVVIDPATKTATGVEFVKNGRVHRVKATKEVILSAGAFHSPQLLMLSGVGPKRHLQEFGIPVINDLPVGEVMYDHNTFAGLTYLVNKPITIQLGFFDKVLAFLNYAKFRRGPLSSTGAAEALGYIKTTESTDPEDVPDVELIFVGLSLHTDLGLIERQSFRISDAFYNAFWKPLEGLNGFLIAPMLLHPKSRGYIKLRSKNPFDSPKLYGEMFTDPENKDFKTFVASVREIQKIASAPAFRRYGTTLSKIPIPGCEHLEFDSDEYWGCGLRRVTTTLHHQISTCKMGPKWDSEAVVDSELRVYGIKRLRVADISVVPRTLSAHTNVPAIMIGEKAADLIKSDWV